MSEKIIRIKSGNEEITMNVTEEEYRNYFRPWWQMKKKDQRNRASFRILVKAVALLHAVRTIRRAV